ncbi:acyl-CoA dehydrogenase family protein [Aeromicrobium panaciterrae]|uniref:acyl-CoA dehydrogenase family protein n=1 Tax=Aeromicrobium panaciterrae TaxID=363861 RepID=UPI0031DA3048
MAIRATTTLDEIAAEAHAFLEPRVARLSSDERFGEGPDDLVGTGLQRGQSELDEVEAARVWQRQLFDAGLAWVDGPKEYGGRGLSGAHRSVVQRVLSEYEVPNTACFMVGHDIVGPTILEHGTPAQKAAYLPGIWRGDIICCQLFSEPDAGSDLASLRTRAEPTDQGWVLNGQKVWSSFAHFAQIGELLARSGDPADRHRGITAFLVDMDAPGVDVRPLRQITGSEHFNEVFLDDVAIADDRILGEVNGGWQIALTTLSSERSLMGDEHSGLVRDPVRRLFDLAEATGAAADPAVQEVLAEAWEREHIVRQTARRAMSGDLGDASGSVIKLLMTDDLEFYIAAATRLLGTRMVVDTGSWGTYSWNQLVLGAPAHRIAGGSDEIQKNIIAERILGLPRDPRPSIPDQPSAPNTTRRTTSDAHR